MQEVYCCNKQQASLICISENCDLQNPFICPQLCNPSQSCQKKHNGCTFRQIQAIKQLFKKKINSNQRDFQKYRDYIEQIINKTIKRLLTQSNQYFLQWKSRYGLSKQVISFHNFIPKSENDWTGKKLSKILKQLNSNTILEKFEQSQKQKEKQLIQSKTESLMKRIQKLYPKYEGLNEKIIQIKEKYLSDVNKRLLNLKEYPSQLQLKFSNVWWSWTSSLNQLAQALRNPYLKQLHTLTIYYPETLGQDQDLIASEKQITKALLEISTFEKLNIIAHGIVSKQGFQMLEQRFYAKRKLKWYTQQKF